MWLTGSKKLGILGILGGLDMDLLWILYGCCVEIPAFEGDDQPFLLAMWKQVKIHQNPISFEGFSVI